MSYYITGNYALYRKCHHELSILFFYFDRKLGVIFKHCKIEFASFYELYNSNLRWETKDNINIELRELFFF